MVSAEEIRNIILRMADKKGSGNPFYAVDVAKAVDQENWENLLGHVRLVADVLIKEGKIKEVPGNEETWEIDEERVGFIKVG